jgi:hypothetical protein
VNLKSKDSVTTWMHASSIIVGYGESCPLKQEQKGNDLHHYRMIINLIYKILLNLETNSLNVEEKWASDVDTLVDGLILLYQDPHSYSGKFTEKMHRMRHLVENYQLHGAFKTSNTFHWERAHQFFTKWAFEFVGRHGNENSPTPPKSKMLLEVYKVFLATFLLPAEGASFRNEVSVSDKENGNKCTAQENGDDYTSNGDDYTSNGDDYTSNGAARVSILIDTQEDLAKRYSLQSSEVQFFQKVYKSFSMTTSSSKARGSIPLPFPDTRHGLNYQLGHCVVLEDAPNDIPAFAVINAIMKSTKTSKIFVLLERLYSTKQIDKSHCMYCSMDDIYYPSNCHLEPLCRTCVIEPKAKAAKIRKSREENDKKRYGRNEASIIKKEKGRNYTPKKMADNARIRATKRAEEVAEGREQKSMEEKARACGKLPMEDGVKALNHDSRMRQLSKLFPDLHKIPHEHYHTDGVVQVVEIGNLVTKINMVLDVRHEGPHRAFFYLKKVLRNM